MKPDLKECFGEETKESKARRAVANEIESQNNEIPRNAETVRKRRN